MLQVSLLIVVVFIICHSIRWIPNIWEMKQAGTDKDKIRWPHWIHLLSQVRSSSYKSPAHLTLAEFSLADCLQFLCKLLHLPCQTLETENTSETSEYFKNQRSETIRRLFSSPGTHHIQHKQGELCHYKII